VKVIVCIPARYGSTRFAGKVLAKDTGKFLIQHTWERACLAKLPGKVIIAADDKRIADAAKSFGAECILTSPKHKSGTDRIAEAIKKLADSGQRIADSRELKTKNSKLKTKRHTLNADDIIINLQADEPEIDPQNIDYLANLLIKNKDCPMATLATGFQNAKQIADPNIVKVVVTSHESRATSHGPIRAIYFSRSVIPYDREKGGIGDMKQYLRHVGIYAYRKDFLLKITALRQTPLEKIEKLEQLRAIENGFDILVGKVKHTCDGIDTPQQYVEFVKRYKNSHRGNK
jgi:3-deoxy-manno-octulosonate cytidylyltransferase (CMP-KDO synthetase)